MSLAEIPHGLPAATYTSEASHQEIVERLLSRSWHFVCHASQVPEVGDYMAFTLLDQDLFVVRGADERVRCFYNVCQHRAHQLVSGSGRSRTLVCPYHAWSYNLDGGLRGAPGGKTTPGFEKSAICLTEVRLEDFLGFLFVTLDETVRGLRESYPDVEAAILDHCPDIESRRFADEHRAVEPCNWLVAVENYNECYHCGHVHRAFSEGIVDPKSYDIQPFGEGRVLRHTAGAARGEGRWYDTSGPAYASFYLFPLFSLQIYPGGLVNSYAWRPLAVDRTEVLRGWFSDDGAVDDQLQAVIDLDRDTTFAEDLALVTSVQRGLSSKGYRPGPLIMAPGGGIRSEHSLAALHGWLRECLQ